MGTPAGRRGRKALGPGSERALNRDGLTTAGQVNHLNREVTMQRNSFLRFPAVFVAVLLLTFMACDEMPVGPNGSDTEALAPMANSDIPFLSYVYDRDLPAIQSTSPFGTSSMLAPAEGTIAFDAIGQSPNWPVSLGYQATGTYESGDYIRPTRPGVLSQVEIGLSSWACENGGWNTEDCSSGSGATFNHPITLNLYAVDYTGSAPAAGALIGTVTETFDIPYRPSADAECTGEDAGKFYDERLGACANGYNMTVVFDMSDSDIVVPSEFIYGVQYNTQSYGPDPIGSIGPYNSLNFGLVPPTDVVIGEDVRDGDLFWDGTLNQFSPELWPYTGAAAFTVTNEGHITGGGWFTSPAGASGIEGDGLVTANPDDGWAFNQEDPYTTPAGFTTAEASTGSGSLHVEPITNVGGVDANAKFILRYVPDAPILLSDLDAFSIDFLIDDAGTKFTPNQFYINLYTLTPDPDDGDSWFDCRFDYVATGGSTTAWTTLAFDGAAMATATDDRLIGGDCPTNFDAMPAGSQVLFISVNLGDTSFNDAGIGGYFDNAVLTMAGEEATWDFESITGRASFGFSARYKKGANVPSGNTNFVFQDGGLHFNSSSYEWLVVNQNDSNAQFKGVGAIMGMDGEYGFMLWAGDHDTGDTFRIKIWEAADESSIIYDNGSDQLIEGGNIVVHANKGKGKK